MDWLKYVTINIRDQINASKPWQTFLYLKFEISSVASIAEIQSIETLWTIPIIRYKSHSNRVPIRINDFNFFFAFKTLLLPNEIDFSDSIVGLPNGTVLLVYVGRLIPLFFSSRYFFLSMLFSVVIFDYIWLAGLCAMAHNLFYFAGANISLWARAIVTLRNMK